MSELKKLFKETIDINRKIRKIKRKSKALDKIIKLTKKYDLELTRTEFNNEEVLMIIGIMEEV